MNESITIKKQDENNVIDELKSKNRVLEELVDDLKNQLLSLQKRNEVLEYAKRHYMQRTDEFEEERKKLLTLNKIQRMKINCTFTQGYQLKQYLT